jgi:hypothetical protein
MEIYKCAKTIKKACNHNLCSQKLNKPAIVSLTLDIFTLADAVFYELSFDIIKPMGDHHFSIKKVKIREKIMFFFHQKIIVLTLFSLK